MSAGRSSPGNASVRTLITMNDMGLIPSSPSDASMTVPKGGQPRRLRRQACILAMREEDWNPRIDVRIGAQGVGSALPAMHDRRRTCPHLLAPPGSLGVYKVMACTEYCASCGRLWGRSPFP